MVMSPHLRVYKMPQSAWLSIAHRATGVLMFLIFLFLAFDASIFIFSSKSNGSASLTSYFDILRKVFIGRICIFILVSSSALHLANGIRYLIIDFFGFGTTKASIRVFATVTTVVFLLIFSLLLTNLLFLTS